MYLKYEYETRWTEDDPTSLRYQPQSAADDIKLINEGKKWMEGASSAFEEW